VEDLKKPHSSVFEAMKDILGKDYYELADYF